MSDPHSRKPPAALCSTVSVTFQIKFPDVFTEQLLFYLVNGVFPRIDWRVQRLTEWTQVDMCTSVTAAKELLLSNADQ